MVSPVTPPWRRSLCRLHRTVKMVEPYRAVTVELVNPINPSVRLPSGLREQCVAVFVVHTDERSALNCTSNGHSWSPRRFVIGTTTDPPFVELSVWTGLSASALPRVAVLFRSPAAVARIAE